jgi:AcrR family transcriptional regulator
MQKKSKTTSRPRAPLTRERVLKAALTLVDKGGVEELSMRTVAGKLGVEAMSLYRHVKDKQDLLNGVADLVLSEVEVPPPGTPWREAMRRRALSAREVFIRHPSSALVVEACATMTPSRLRYSDAITGLLLADGFDATLAYRAFLTLDSYIFGFTMQELSWPHPASGDEVPAQVSVPPALFPNFAAVMGAVMSKVGEAGLVQSYADEFRFGLELVLDALERQRGQR